jgi:hypothetical protein
MTFKGIDDLLNVVSWLQNSRCNGYKKTFPQLVVKKASICTKKPCLTNQREA